MRYLAALLLLLAFPAQAALTFVNSSSQYVVLGGTLSALQNVAGATLMCWVKPTTVAAEHGIIEHSIGATPSSYIRAGISVSSGALAQAFGRRLDSDSRSAITATTFGTLSAGTTYHIAGRFNYSTGSLDVFVNGMLSNTLTISAWNGNSSNTASLLANIGAGTNAPASLQDGVVDGCRVYGRALDAGEIQTIYYAHDEDGIVYSLYGWYKLLEAGLGLSSATVVDEMGHNNGTATNSPLYSGRLY